MRKWQITWFLNNKHLSWVLKRTVSPFHGYVSVDIRKKRKVWFKYRDMYCSCTDPERFVRGGPTLTKVFESMRGSKYHYQRAIIGPPAKRHLMPFHWRADECTKLNAGLIDLWFFRGSGPALLRNLIFLWFFRGGSDPLPPPPPPPPLWIRPCCFM